MFRDSHHRKKMYQIKQRRGVYYLLKMKMWYNVLMSYCISFYCEFFYEHVLINLWQGFNIKTKWLFFNGSYFPWQSNSMALLVISYGDIGCFVVILQNIQKKMCTPKRIIIANNFCCWMVSVHVQWLKSDVICVSNFHLFYNSIKWHV